MGGGVRCVCGLCSLGACEIPIDRKLSMSRPCATLGGDSLRSPDKDSDSWGSRLLVGPDAGMTLDGVEEYLIYGTTRAEIMEYLSQEYGPAFVGDLIKHLPKLRVETLKLAQLRSRITASAR